MSETELPFLYGDSSYPSEIRQIPFSRRKKILVWEKTLEESLPFAGNWLSHLSLSHAVEFFQGDDFFSLQKRIENFHPHLLLLSQNKKEALEKLSNPHPRPKIEVVLYETFPQNREELSWNFFFPFGKEKYNHLLSTIQCYQSQVERTSYNQAVSYGVQYAGTLLQELGCHHQNFAHPLEGHILREKGLWKIPGCSSIDQWISKSTHFLFISPHGDDSEIGAGAWMRFLLEENFSVDHWILTGSPGEADSREKEIQRATETLCREAHSMEVRFWKISKTDLESSPTCLQVQEALERILKKKEERLALCMPHPQDHHPTHCKVFHLMMKILEKMKGQKEILVFFYFTPWSGNQNRYFLSSINHGEGKRVEIASLEKQRLGKGGLVGEICSAFGKAGLYGEYGEKFFSFLLS